MSLMDVLRKDILTARKNRDQATLATLTALIGEAAMVGKNAGNRETTDSEALRVIKKFLDNAKEMQPMCSRYPDALVKVNREIEIFESYMPTQLSEDQLRTIIADFKKENTEANMGEVMKYLQLNYSGQYDGKLASQVAKEAA